MGKFFTIKVSLFLLLHFQVYYGAPIRNCYFDKYDKKVNRDIFPPFSETKSDCCGDVVTLEFVNKNHPVNPKFLFGARHVADLILSRTGDFVNWDDPTESQDAFSRIICICHLDELFKKFDDRSTKHVKHYTKCGKSVSGCTMAQEISGHHFGQNRDPKSRLTYEESKAILNTINQVIQTGIPLCGSCKNWAVDKVQQYQERKHCEQQGTCYIDKEKETEVDNDTCEKGEREGKDNIGDDIIVDGNDEISDGSVSDDDSESEEEYAPDDKPPPRTPARPGKKELIAFAKAVGMDIRFGLASKYEFVKVKRQSQRKKIKAGKVLFNEMSSLIAPGSEKFFKHDICSDEVDSWISIKDVTKEDFLRNLSALYISEPDKEYKLHYLSHMVPLVSLDEIQKYLKVTPHYYKKATAYALNPKITKIPHIGYERWDHQQLEYFVRFITSAAVVTGLPYKSKSATLSTGEKIDIPSLLRLQRSKQIIELYKKKLDSENLNHLMLPESTMYKILNFCVATKTKSLKCVDYYLVDAGEAVEKLLKMTDKWESEDIVSVYEAKVLKNGIQESFRYLRTDFVLNLNFTSNTTSHCINNALSSPNEAAFSNSCSNDASHEHATVCTRCNKFKELMRDLVAITKTRMSQTSPKASIARKREVEDDVVKVETYVERLEDYRMHVIRAVHSRQTWANIVGNLNEHTALLTFDWAQKLEPQYYHESQAKYFGKKGIGYHIVHVLTKIGEFLAEHTYVHIIESATQKSHEVLAILDDVVSELKQMGIVNFIGRSDNAGCYRSTEIIMGLNKVGKNNEAEVNRWSFSEVQTGKGACDRKAGVVKSRVDEHVSQKNDVATAHNFYNALTLPYVIPYMTIVHASIKKTAKSKVKGFPNIQLYSDYTVEKDGVIAYKAAGIGKGLKISSKKYEDDIEIADMTVIKRATPLTEEDVNEVLEKHRIKNNLKTKFWNTIRDPLAHQKVAEDDPVAFPCPAEYCDDKFLTIEELEAHIETGNHTIRKPERETLRTHALKIYQQCANELLAETKELSAAQLTFCATVNENEGVAEDFDFFEGNALRTGKKKCNPITEKARKFVKNLFDLGEKDSSQKVSHEKAVQMMEAAKDPQNPSLLFFRATELLTSQQINGLFTRFKKATTSNKRVHEDESDELEDATCGDGEEDDDDEDEETDEAETAPLPKKPRRVSSRKGLKNRLQLEEEQEIEEIRKEVRKTAARRTF